MQKLSSLPSCRGFENTLSLSLSHTHTDTHTDTGNVGQQQDTDASQRCASADTFAGGTVLSDKKQAAVGIFLSLSAEILKITDYFEKRNKKNNEATDCLTHETNALRYT